MGGGSVGYRLALCQNWMASYLDGAKVGVVAVVQ